MVNTYKVGRLFNRLFRNNPLAYLSLLLTLLATLPADNIFAYETRLMPIISGSLELHQDDYNDAQIDLFSGRFS